MLNASRTSCPTLKVFAGQRSIDAEGGARTFGRRYNHQLNVPDDVAGHEHAWDAGRFVLPALDAAMTGKLTSKVFRELGLAAARCVEEERRALESTTAAKDDLAQLPARTLQALDTILDHCDSIALQVSLFRC